MGSLCNAYSAYLFLYTGWQAVEQSHQHGKGRHEMSADVALQPSVESSPVIVPLPQDGTSMLIGRGGPTRQVRHLLRPYIHIPRVVASVAQDGTDGSLHMTVLRGYINVHALKTSDKPTMEPGTGKNGSMEETMFSHRMSGDVPGGRFDSGHQVTLHDGDAFSLLSKRDVWWIFRIYPNIPVHLSHWLSSHCERHELVAQMCRLVSLAAAISQSQAAGNSCPHNPVDVRKSKRLRNAGVGKPDSTGQVCVHTTLQNTSQQYSATATNENKCASSSPTNSPTQLSNATESSRRTPLDSQEKMISAEAGQEFFLDAVRKLEHVSFERLDESILSRVRSQREGKRESGDSSHRTPPSRSTVPPSRSTVPPSELEKLVTMHAPPLQTTATVTTPPRISRLFSRPSMDIFSSITDNDNSPMVQPTTRARCDGIVPTPSRAALRWPSRTPSFASSTHIPPLPFVDGQGIQPYNIHLWQEALRKGQNAFLSDSGNQAQNDVTGTTGYVASTAAGMESQVVIFDHD